LPALTAADPWEKRMAEGVAFLQRKAKEGDNA
jgi:cytochrome c5